MKRFHVNVSVGDLDRSIEFYRTLFGEEPALVKEDYAKWMLDDPRVNFAVSLSKSAHGVNHVGLQADTAEELAEIQARLREARETTLDQPDAECCYARSTKTWVRDPDDVAWETFVTHEQITEFGNDVVTASMEPVHTKKVSCC
jgi:catechol 2,3-dioxygenase-like lactoylglutathione lyase family enzyme